MNRSAWQGRTLAWLRRRSLVDVLSFVLILVGAFLGLSVHVGWLALVAAGAFGPGLLRDLRVLDDQDEFQRAASATAGYRAFLVGGLLLVLLIVGMGIRTGERTHEMDLLLIVLVWMLVVYFFSYAFSFWDATRAAVRVLVAFGLFWLAFVVLSHGGDPIALVMEAAVVPLPFFLCALAARRWPRAVGTVLLVGAIGSLFFFDLIPNANGDGDVLVALILPLPLAAAGLALLGTRHDPPELEPGD